MPRMVPGRSTLRYALTWLAAGAAAIALFVALDRGPQEVSLPPVQSTDLASAVRTSGCKLDVAGVGETLNPPVDGDDGGEAVAPGVYEDAVPAGALVGALRRGTLVLQYRPGTDDGIVDELRRLQDTLPRAVVVAPNGTGMAFEVAVAAHRRLLGCTTYGEAQRDAVRLFLGKYLGTRDPGAPAPRRTMGADTQ